jgi:beta-galactosidase
MVIVDKHALLGQERSRMTHNMISPKAPFIWHGGDYNPEQWPKEIWQDDFRLMQEAGWTVATIGVFSWVCLQPSEHEFTFEWLDDVMDGLHAHGIKVVLATPSAAHPQWMSQAYPQIMRSDEFGQRKHHGGRVNYCPNSPDYRRFSGEMARRLAERYKDHPALLLWHISNEYAGHCFCETCAAAFRVWLQEKYETLDELNARWWTNFWSHRYTDWSQIMPPLKNGEIHLHGLNVDYFRFMSDTNIACYRNERDIVRAITPEVPITTNFMGAYKPLDYRKWAKDLDVIAWDCYPQPNHSAGEIAFLHDTMRGLKDGQPFLLMEQTPSSQNWQWVNAIKRPQVTRLWSYLALAHGAESVMYFQWRRGRGGVEKLHGAIVEHSGRKDTRVFREIAELGAELKRLAHDFLGSVIQAKVGIILDWDNWHALDDAVGPVRNKRYYETVAKHYCAFYRHNAAIDVIFPDSDLSAYDIVVAPMLYMLKEGFAEKIEAFVESGGSFVTTYLSGLVDETDLAFETGYPGPLQKVLGLWIEEIDALYEGQSNTIVTKQGIYPCRHIADVVRIESAETLGVFGSDYYAGMPAFTKNRFGKGAAYYIASDPDALFLESFYKDLLTQHKISYYPAPEGIEITIRHKDAEAFIFVLNHNSEAISFEFGTKPYLDLLSNERCKGAIQMPAYGVRILLEAQS